MSSVPPVQRKELLLTAVFAMVTPVVYGLITDHIWEDYFITFRHSRNLVQGHGLVFQPGERLHGFTSPLGVLLPAVFDRLVGSESYVPALNAFRAVCVAAFAGGAVLILRALQLAGSSGPARFVFILLYATEPKSVGFTVNGMETALVLFFLAQALYVFCSGWSRRWLLGGVAFAGLMWTRPDSFVYIAAVSAGSLIFTAEPRRQVLVALLQAAAVCAVLYLPWFVFAWWYYGSPVPHTVTAKAPVDWLAHLQQTLGDLPAIYFDRITAVLKPSYASFSACWPAWLDVPATVLGLFSCWYWLIPSADRLGRLASLAFCISIGYLMLQTITYPWYMPPAGLLAFVAFSSGLFTLAAKLSDVLPIARPLAISVCAIVGLTSVWLLYSVTRQTAIGQRVIENGHRRQMGLWLKEHVQPGETVYLESLGYIGFFSNAKIDDWPGLVSQRVVELRRQRIHDVATMVIDLKPDWIVARSSDLKKMADLREVQENYRPVEVFDAVPALEEMKHVVGIQCLLYDARFAILRRITEEERSQP